MPVPSDTYPPDPTGGSDTSTAEIKWEDTAMLYRGFRDLVEETNLPPDLRGTPWTDFKKKKFNVDTFSPRTVGLMWERLTNTGEFDNYLVKNTSPHAGVVLSDLNEAEKEVLLEGDLYFRLGHPSGEPDPKCFCCSVVKLTWDSSAELLRVDSPTAWEDCKHNFYTPGSPTTPPAPGVSNWTKIFNSEIIGRAVDKTLTFSQFVEVFGVSETSVGSNRQGTLNLPCQNYKVFADIFMTEGVKDYAVKAVLRLDLYGDFRWPIKASYYNSDIMGMLKLAGATRNISTDWNAPGSDTYLIKQGHAATSGMIFWKAKQDYPGVGITAGPESSSPDAGCFHIYFSTPNTEREKTSSLCKNIFCSDELDNVTYTCGESSDNPAATAFAGTVVSPIVAGTSCSSKMYAKTLRQLGVCLKVLQDDTTTSGAFTQVQVLVGGKQETGLIIDEACSCCSNPRVKPYDMDYRREVGEYWTIGGLVEGEIVFDGLVINVPNMDDVDNPFCENVTVGDTEGLFVLTAYFGVAENDCYVIYPWLEINSDFSVFGSVWFSAIVVDNSDCEGCQCDSGYCTADAEPTCVSTGGLGSEGSGLTYEYESKTSSAPTLCGFESFDGSQPCKRWRKIEQDGGSIVSTETVTATNTVTTTLTYTGSVEYIDGTCEEGTDTQLLTRTIVSSETGPGDPILEPGNGVQNTTSVCSPCSSGNDPAFGTQDGILAVRTATTVTITGCGTCRYPDGFGAGVPAIYSDTGSATATLSKEDTVEAAIARAVTTTGVSQCASTGQPTGDCLTYTSSTSVKMTVGGKGPPGTSRSYTLIFKTQCSGDPAPEPTYTPKPITVSFDANGDATEQSFAIPQPPAGCTTCLSCTIDTYPGTECCARTYDSEDDDPCKALPDQTFTYTITVYGKANTTYDVTVGLTDPTTGITTYVTIQITTDATGKGTGTVSGSISGDTCISSTLAEEVPEV